jgi:hypothetical protein
VGRSGVGRGEGHSAAGRGGAGAIPWAAPPSTASEVVGTIAASNVGAMADGRAAPPSRQAAMMRCQRGLAITMPEITERPVTNDPDGSNDLDQSRSRTTAWGVRALRARPEIGARPQTEERVAASVTEAGVRVVLVPAVRTTRTASLPRWRGLRNERRANSCSRRGAWSTIQRRLMVASRLWRARAARPFP